MITGLGVVAPGASDLASFKALLRAGRSGLRHDDELERLGFHCTVSGRPEVSDDLVATYLDPLERKRFRSKGLRFGLISCLSAYGDASLAKPTPDASPQYRIVFGAGVPGIDVLGQGIEKIERGKVRSLGTSMIQMQMPSSTATIVASKLGFGGRVTCNALACATGTEALGTGMEWIRRGECQVAVVGSCESEGAHLWGAFDAIGALARGVNGVPEAASRPLCERAAGFVPASGAGALVLESLTHALRRGARIYCEVLGAASNCGGGRGGGFATSSPEGIERCITDALDAARVSGESVDAISGHLTGTCNDGLEVECWSKALGRKREAFPKINAPKSLIGHALSASGAIELVASALQLEGQFLHPSRNIQKLHDRVLAVLDETAVVRETAELSINVLAKASFGFGDVNACAILGAWR